MKYIFFISALLFLSCGNGTSKPNRLLIYEFENPESVSTNAMQGTIETLNMRLGVLSSNYEVKLNNKQQIEVRLNSEDNQDYLNSMLTNQGKLEFWEVIKASELSTFIMEANEALKKENDSINPLYDLIQSHSLAYGQGLFSVAVKDTSLMRQYLNSKEVRLLTPSKFRHSKFLFGIPNLEDHVPLYLVKTPPNGQALVNETHIIDASQIENYIGKPCVSVKMNQIGSNRWERMTGMAYQNQSQIAITLNDLVYTAPTASQGAIKGGNTEISGNFTLREAKDLALILSTHQRIPKLKFVNASAITD
ncbi:SecDF P1 head subdomain-containing protein [Psychroserpens sp. MEBiC05023]